jgi:hypothetical protein
MDVLAGVDFFTVEVLTWRGLITYYVLFLIEIGSRRVSLGGITRHPDSRWMEQVARNATKEGTGYLNKCRYVLHDRDRKFCREFRDTLAAGGVRCLALPARSPNLNSHAERWVRLIKRGVPVETDSGRGELVAACGLELSRPLSPMNEIIRVRAISCCSLLARLHLHLQLSRARFVVGSASGACSSTTTATPHEYFDRT